MWLTRDCFCGPVLNVSSLCERDQRIFTISLPAALLKAIRDVLHLSVWWVPDTFKTINGIFSLCNVNVLIFLFFADQFPIWKENAEEYCQAMDFSVKTREPRNGTRKTPACHLCGLEDLQVFHITCIRLSTQQGRQNGMMAVSNHGCKNSVAIVFLQT